MQLIKITEQNGKQIVSARELHSFLESKKQFADWIKHRIKKYGLTENQDFVTVSPNGEANGRGGHNAIEYALTLDAAKELAMVEGNAKGKQARQYFIECEKALKTLSAPKELTRLELIELAMESEKERLLLAEKVEIQEKTILIQAPKVKYANEVLNSESTHTTTTIAKELGMSAPTLNKTLKERGIQYRHQDTWVLYQKYQSKGYTKTKTYPYLDSEGKQKTNIQTVWTEAGREFIHRILNPSVN